MPESQEKSSRPHQAPVRIRLEPESDRSMQQSSEIPDDLAAELNAEFAKSQTLDVTADGAGTTAVGATADEPFDDELDAFLHSHAPLIEAVPPEEPEEGSGEPAAAAVEEKFPWLAPGSTAPVPPAETLPAATAPVPELSLPQTNVTPPAAPERSAAALTAPSRPAPAPVAEAISQWAPKATTLPEVATATIAEAEIVDSPPLTATEKIQPSLEIQASPAEDASRVEEDRMSSATSSGSPDAAVPPIEDAKPKTTPAPGSELPPFDLALGMQRNSADEPVVEPAKSGKSAFKDLFAKLPHPHLQAPHMPEGGLKAPSVALPPVLENLLAKIPPKLRMLVLGGAIALILALVAIVVSGLFHHPAPKKMLTRLAPGATVPLAVPIGVMPKVPAVFPVKHKAAARKHRTTIVQANVTIVPDGTVLTKSDVTALKKSLPATCGVHGEHVSRWSYHGGFLLCTVSGEEGMGAYALERDDTGGFTYLGGLTEAPTAEGLVDLGVPLEDGRYLLKHLKKL